MTDLPDSIQLLLTAGAQDETFRECFLEDPLLAARRACVALSDTEHAILRAVPRAQLVAMIDGLAVSNPQRRRFLRSAATAALTVFAGTALAACESPPEETEPRAPEPVEPDPEPEPPPTNVAEAMAAARRAKEPLLVVIRSTDSRYSGFFGQMSAAHHRETTSDMVCRYPSGEIRAAAKSEGMRLYEHGVKVEWTTEGCRTADELATERGLTKLPTLLFFDAEGEELFRRTQPTTEEDLITAIELAGALIEAKRENRPLMVVVRTGDIGGGIRVLTTGMLSESEYRRSKRQEQARALFMNLGERIHALAERSGFLAVEYRVTIGLKLPREHTDDIAADDFARGHELTDLPTVLFLAPDGEELGRIVHPQTEQELQTAIESAAAAFGRREESIEGEGDG